MPKRPPFHIKPPEVGDIWQDAYGGEISTYLLLKHIKNMYSSHKFLVIRFEDNREGFVFMDDYKVNWVQRA
jgi:hypothetical protein